MNQKEITLLGTIDQILQDRTGKPFSVWYIYQHGRIILVQFTRDGVTSRTERIEFAVAA